MNLNDCVGFSDVSGPSTSIWSPDWTTTWRRKGLLRSVYANVEIRLVGHLMDAFPGAFWPGRRGLSYVLWLAKHWCWTPASWIPVCILCADPLWLCAGITLVFVALSVPGPCPCTAFISRIDRWEKRHSSRQGHMWPVGMNLWIYATHVVVQL